MDDPFAETKFWCVIFLLSLGGLVMAVLFGLWQEKIHDRWVAKNKEEATRTTEEGKR